MPLITDELVQSVLGALMLYPQYRYLLFSVKVPSHYEKALKILRANLNDGYDSLVLKLEDEYPLAYKWADFAPPEWDFENFYNEYSEKWKKAKLVEGIKSLASVVDKLETNQLHERLSNLLKTTMESGVEMKGIHDVIDDLIDDLVRLKQTGGIKFPFLSSIVNDLLGGELVILAGRPGMGKTTLMLNMAEQMARDGVKAGFISLEMSAKSLTLKLVQRFWEKSLLKNISSLTDEELEQIEAQLEEFKNLPLFFSDRITTNIFNILATLKYFVVVSDVKVFFIDYLQLLRARRSNRDQELAYITRLLKEFAIENNVSIFLGSQLNRNVERRENKMPILADLRESGAIEQDADVVVMLYRPGYYNQEEDPNKLILKVAKQRNGVVGKVELDYNLEKQVVKEITP